MSDPGCTVICRYTRRHHCEAPSTHWDRAQRAAREAHAYELPDVQAVAAERLHADWPRVMAACG